jgi:hypothetical protein
MQNCFSEYKKREGYNEPPSIPPKCQSVQIVEFRSRIGEVKQGDVERVRTIVSKDAHVVTSNVGMNNACTVKFMDRPCEGICLY